MTIPRETGGEGEGGGYVDLKSVLRSQYDVCNGPVIIVVLNVYSVIRP